MIVVYLRNVGTKEDMCWVVCAKGTSRRRGIRRLPAHIPERKKNANCKTTVKHSQFLQGNQRMGPSRLARHSGQNSSPDNDMRFTAKSRKTVNDRGTSCPTVKHINTGTYSQ